MVKCPTCTRVILNQTSLTSCRREAATICPRPGLQAVTRYTSYTHLDPLLTQYPCWPASSANQSSLVTLSFDLLTLKVVVSESRATWARAVPILVFLGLSVLDLGPMYAADVKQTEVRQHHRLMPPPIRGGHNNIIDQTK